MSAFWLQALRAVNDFVCTKAARSVHFFAFWPVRPPHVCTVSAEWLHRVCTRGAVSLGETVNVALLLSVIDAA